MQCFGCLEMMQCRGKITQRIVVVMQCMDELIQCIVEVMQCMVEVMQCMVEVMQYMISYWSPGNGSLLGASPNTAPPLH